MEVGKLYLFTLIHPVMFKMPVTIKISDLTLEQAKELVKGKEIVNMIGNPVIVELLVSLLDLKIKPNTTIGKMTVGDEAIIFSLDPDYVESHLESLSGGQRVKSVEEICKIGHALFHISVS